MRIQRYGSSYLGSTHFNLQIQMEGKNNLSVSLDYGDFKRNLAAGQEKTGIAA